VPKSDDFLVVAKTLVAKDQNSCSVIKTKGSTENKPNSKILTKNTF